ncbi:amino acid adenylation domain-containing protein [Pedobacter sp. P351]|uniref:amino acid adenylation domain-containing protein n=1 Tax=Pedobacter superstes TaxID=3133441 RepID=UPI0030A8CFA3
MTIKEFISSLDKMSFSLSVEDGKLHLKGDKKRLSREQIEAIKLNKDVIDYIKENKEELIKYIQDFSGPSSIKKSKNISSIYRLSGLQEGMLFHGLYDEEARAYEVHFNCDLIGLNPETFKKTWSYILRHHSILRSAFYYDSFSTPVQCVYNEVALSVKELDFRDLNERDQAAAVEKYEAEDRNTGFDFKKPPLTRFTLIRLSEDRYRMIWTTHHILFDGWSLPILMEEFLTIYEQLASGIKVKDAEEDRYEDYIRYIERVDKEEEEQYWRDYLKGIEHSTLLPFIGTTTERTTGTGEYRSMSFFLDGVTTEKIQNYAQKHRVTVNTLMQGVWSYLLHQYTGKSDIVYGVIVSGRPDDLQNVEKRVGMYINTLPLHSRIDLENSIPGWLQQIQEEQVSSRRYQYTPLNYIQRWNGISGVLFDTLLVFENYPASKLITSKKWCLGVENIQSHEQTNYPLSVIINSSEEIKVGFSYNTQLLDELYVREISNHFEHVLLQMVESDSSSISNLRLLTSSEEHQILEGFRSEELLCNADSSLVSLFEEQVVKSRDAVAVIEGETRLSYSALEEAANRLAHYLQSKGVGRGSLVPVCMERGTGLIIGILGILKAGAGYVPIDPAYPEDRISYMLEDSQARIVLSSKASRRQIKTSSSITIIETDGSDQSAILNAASSRPENGLLSEDLAYVIYTSGSTGTPKGVEITHKNVTSFIAWCQDEFSSSRFETVFFSTSICFDLSVFEIFYPLSIGKSFRILENGLAISEFLSIDKDILLNTVPSVVAGLLAEGANLSQVTVLNMAGEPVPEQILQNLDTSSIEVRNLYGPTEDTTYSTIYRLKKEAPILIGKPIAGTQIYIVNARHQLCPAGIVGELCISGNGLARGYLNRADLTAEKFVSNPFSNKAGARMYKTGDLARWLPDGNIEYLGRIDDQVKIRGYRIELGEIENVLRQHPGVRQSVVLAREDSSGNRRLVGYVVPEGTFDKQNLQTYLQEKLPEYMVPSLWVELDRIPLTPNGKTDKKALPEPDMSGQQSQEYIAPGTETEQKLASIWQELLGAQQIGIHDNFFELGGHSLLAMRVISSIRRELKADVAIKDLFMRPTISQMGLYLDEQVKGPYTPAMKAVNRPPQIPLSFSQERLWFIDQLEGSRQYHMPSVLKIKGDLNIDALNNALNDIVNRHEVLRSVIIQKNGQPYQQPGEINRWKLEVIDGSVYSEHNELKEFIQNLIQAPFDLSKDFMLRAHLILSGEREYLLVITLHHISSDGWSRSILVKEMVELYASYQKGSIPTLQPLPLQYADYAIWQRSYLQGEVLDKKLDYWKKQLDGTATLNLPTDFIRPVVQSTKGASAGFKISQDVSEKINELNQSQGTTLYMTLLAIFKVLLHRYTGQNDICVGTGIAGRQHYEMEGLIGFFVNTLAMRSQVYGETAFSEFLKTVKATTLDAYTHQEVPFEKVVDAVVHERDLSRTPLVQVTFIVQNTPDIPQIVLDDVELAVENYDHITSRFDISFSVKSTADGIECLVEYCADLFYPETIQRMIGHYMQLLGSVLENPDKKIDLLLLTTEEEERQLASFSNSDLLAQPSGETLISLFEKQVKATPDAIALIFGKQTVTYKSLNEKANQLARFLITLGVQKETLVPICVGRSTEMIIGILGILKAAGAYVPIDPSYPRDRIGFVLEDTKANLIVSSSSAGENLVELSGIRIIFLDGADKELIDAQHNTNLPLTINHDQLAYAIYTSGSTGKPKGVLIEHRSVSNYIAAQTKYFEIDSTDRILQFSNYCFDASVEQIFLALSNGASLVLFEEGLQLNPDQFSVFLNDAGVTHLHSTPFFLENLIPQKCGQLRRVVAGGDLCRRELVNKWEGTADFYNKYGPTETAISVAEYKAETNSLKNATSVPIGKPLRNVSVYVLDKNFSVCPIGIPGEIYIGGIQVSRGYLNQPELTAEKFVENPTSAFPASRLYKTGDLGRWLPDGNLEYLGRMDDQVKIHGYRIETGEIESVLNALTSVDNSCVVVKEDKDTRNNRLVVYYLPNHFAVKVKEAQLYDEQVASWKVIHENEYVTADENIESPEFNILGWNDSFTRDPIPAEHMREWLTDIIHVIFSDRVGHVLEIGSGSGLIYYQLAGKIDRYIGTDFSKASINLIRNRINLGLRDYGPTELQVAAAHEVTVNDAEEIDTIILNSIIQYFPGEDYLSKVIENGISILGNNGRIVIGDVRDLRTLKLFKARLKLEKFPDFVTLPEFNWSLEQDMLNEEELCFSPGYFYGLQRKYPQITHVEIVWKHGSYVNELSAYRYTVVIYVGLEKEVFKPDWQIWNPIEGSAKIIAQLEKEVPVIAVRDVPNPRLQREGELLRILKDGSVNNVGQLLAVLHDVGELDEVNKMISTVERKGYSYKLFLDKDPLKLNILMEKSPSDRFIEQVYNENSAVPDGRRFTNIPMFNDICSQLQKDIRNLMLEKLPEYMVPSKFVAIQKMPLNRNGKIDRKFLSSIENKGTGSRTDYQAPRNEVEKSISDIWKSLLNIEQAGINENFFELGGHSLLAVRVISMIRKELNVELMIRDLFSYPTISELAEHLRTLGLGASLPSITVMPRPEHIPLSFSQERLWFIDQLEGSIQYQMPAVLRLKGRLNREALNYALLTIINRHEILRTVIREHNGEGHQYLQKADNWALQIIDKEDIKNGDIDLHLLIQNLIIAPFDLAGDYMLRAQLIEVEEEDHILVATMHHIASDGWSTSVLVKEVVELYAAYTSNRDPQLPALAIQYTDYAIWQRNYFQGDLFDKKLAYWIEKLKDVSPLQLPSDYDRPLVKSVHSDVVNVRLDIGLLKELESLSQKQGATLFMTLLSAFKVLMYKYTGQSDICIGTPIAGRTQLEVENLIGFFVNTLALRSEVRGEESFTSFLQDVRTTTIDAFDNQDVPFEKVVDAVVTTRDAGKNALFQIMFVLQNTPDVPELRLEDLIISSEAFEHTTTQFDFTINLAESENGLNVRWEFKNDLYKRSTIERMLSHYKILLESIVSSPETKIGLLPIISKAEQAQIGSFNINGNDYSKQTIAAVFEEQTSKTPNEIALIFGQEEITYKELNERANRVAHYLHSKNVRSEELVLVCVDRSADLMIGILGILKAGAAYVPVDAGYPADRIRFMLEDTGAKIALISKANKLKLAYTTGLDLIEIDGKDQISILSQPSLSPQRNITPNNLAYVIYTSGSTGKPKGVMVEHGNVVSLVKGVDYVNLTESDRLLVTGSPSFDATTFEYWSMLLNGGRLIVCSEAELLDSNKLSGIIRNQGVTMMWFTSSWFNQLVDTDIKLFDGLQTILVGGEKLSEQHIGKFRELYPEIRLVNGYGPTENTTFSLTYEINKLEGLRSIPIGKPLSNREVYIFNEARQVVPVGVPGEIFLGGAGLARGYLNRPQLTAEKFISNPLLNGTSSIVYKTGDLGRWLPDGNIEYLGRTDEQVKIRGYRVEPGEIESVILESGMLNQAVVIARADSTESKTLVGYVVPGKDFDKEALQRYLTDRLPDYMIPAQWVELDQIPLTANGKTDKKALPEPNISEQLSQGYTAPETEIQKALTEIWQEVLDVKQIGIRDDFFELGGHSLLAIRLISAIRKQLGTEIAISEIFNCPTIALLAAQIEIQPEAAVLPPISSVYPRPENIPLSFSQDRLWFIDQMEGSAHYHIPVVLNLTGNLNTEALQNALQKVINRHEVLRTVINEENGVGYQYILEPDSWTLKLTDGNKCGDLETYIAQLIKEPFDLSEDHMIRAELINLTSEEYFLIVTLHHIASDGWSASILVNEIVELYEAYAENRKDRLSNLPIQYADYAIWQRTQLEGNVLDKKLAYWREKLNEVGTLQLPTDHSRPDVQTYKGASVEFNLDQELVGNLQALSQEQGSTIFMTLLSVFKVLLYRYTGQQDICVGTPIANRTQHELENLIGFFVNTLALRTEVTGDLTFVQLLQAVKTTTLEAYAHQEVPFEKVVDAVVKERELNRSPLFQVLFILQNTPDVPELRLKDVSLKPGTPASTVAKFDLTFTFVETAKSLSGSIQYNIELFEESTIKRMLAHFKELLTSIVKTPAQSLSQLTLLTPSEKHELLHSFNNAGGVYENDINLVALVESQMEKAPSSIALIFEDTRLTYSELNERSNRLAHYLQSKGVKAGSMVPLCIERGAEMITGILAILKAGGAYVPVDPAYPQERITYMLKDSGATLVVSSRAGRSKILNTDEIHVIELDGADEEAIKSMPAANPENTIQADDPAYVIYTSGSTGRPKGVIIRHKNVCSFIYWCQSEFSASRFEIVYATTSICFDLSVFEIFYPLSTGKCFRILESGLSISRYLPEDSDVLVNTVPSVIVELLAEQADLSHLSVLNMAGEPIPLFVVQNLDTERIEVRNLYGPTEDTTYSTVYRLTKDKPVLIGKPITDTQVYILQDDKSLCPVGITGEICLSGAGLSGGYFNRPDLTAEKFIANPFRGEPDAKMYKTGDLGRWLPDGNLEYLGRIDDQVKVRGYRIELGEIESVLNELQEVKQSVILALKDGSGNQRLTAYIVSDGEFDKNVIQAYLQEKLPEYMIPAIWVELDKLPLTSNGKIDKKALPEPDLHGQTGNEYTAPRNQTEQKLAEIWQKLLGVEQIGIHDNFFQLGGHSLLAMRAMSSIRRELDSDAGIKDLFIFPTVAQLASHLEESKGLNTPPVEAGPRPSKIPLSFSQERLWFIDRLEGSVQYNQPTVLRLKGELDTNALDYSIREILKRHEVLRSVFYETDGKPFQAVKSTDEWTMLLADGSKFRKDAQGLKVFIDDLIHEPFNLSSDYMLRAHLIKIDAGDYILVVTLHHIASDAWSLPIIVKEVVELYSSFIEKRSPDLPHLPIQYADFAIWQRQFISDDLLDKKKEYWRRKLDGVLPLQLPTDFNRPAIKTLNGASVSLLIDKELADQLNELSKQEGVTLYMTLLATFNVLLNKYSGEQDICVGASIANRPQQELEGLVGFFVNTLALRNQVDESLEFLQLLKQVKTTMLEAYEYQDVPFEKVVEEVVKERDPSRSPLFQVMLVLLNTPEASALKFGEVELSNEAFDIKISKVDITFHVSLTSKGLHILIVYNTDLFRKDTIDRMAGHFNELLKAVVKNPNQIIDSLQMLTEEEEQQLLNEFNNMQQ